jgi:hypothetical protein
MTLAHLRNGDTLTRLAAGFAVSVSTVWRYLREAIDLLAGHAWDLARAAARATRLAYAIIDGTLVPIDRSPTNGRTTPASTAGTASTSRSWPTRRAGWHGPRQRCPARSTT